MGMLHLIDSAEIDRHNSYDQNGYIFRNNGKIFRAIYHESETKIRALWNCGLVSELIEHELFPASQITDFRTPDSNLIFEHEKVGVITYPHEWSFHMLKDAGILTLRINQIARKYGYQTLDAHGFNIAFHQGHPMFIDLGSFVEISDDFGCNDIGWRPYGEFIRSFYAPLMLWSTGEEFISRQALHGEQMPIACYWRYNSKLARKVPSKLLNQLEFVWYKYKGLNTIPISRFREIVSVSESREKLGEQIISFSKRWGLPFSSVNLEKLESEISAIPPPNIQSKWGEYHTNKPNDDRQHFVVDIIRKFKPSSVLDMAGNAGYFAKMLTDIDGVNWVVCADYDTNAIDHLYLSLRDTKTNLYPVVMNFASSIVDSKLQTVEERFQSDMVIALAVTHHLILTQRLTLDFVMKRLRKLTRKFVAVEFMPLGLYSSAFDKIPKIPMWYNIEWFRQGFIKHFYLIEEKAIDNNRVIFIGRIPD